MVTLAQILQSQSPILEGKRVKLVRHKDHRAEYRDAIKDRQKLLAYQQKQGRDVFGDCEYIVSFIGLERSKSLFFGVFKVLGSKVVNGHYIYNLQKVDAFDGLADRLVIDWGGSARAWLQWYDRQSKNVIEILPAGYIGSFPGLLGFVLEFNELQTLIANPEANHDWKHHLSAVNGVYLILDRKTGNQYIGSAYGREGIRLCPELYSEAASSASVKKIAELEKALAEAKARASQTGVLVVPAEVPMEEFAILAEEQRQKMLAEKEEIARQNGL